MPLAFSSMSHGTIAFGFFNIETDMLLLEQLFFFAHDFCAAAVRSAEPHASKATLRGWRICDAGRIGNLHGAIAGQDLSGFIGATYARFPFPAEPAGFKQSPEGRDNRDEIAAMIADYGEPVTIVLARDPGACGGRVAEYAFSEDGFAQLVAYVDRGGYPRWRDENPPAYVTAMMTRLRELVVYSVSS